jgi:thioredoxin 1
MPPIGPFGKRKERPAPPHEEWPKGTVELGDAQFQSFVDRYPLAAVEFWASWCAPCKAMRPVIRDLASRHRGKVAFGKVNIERHRKLAEDNDVLSIPHIVFFNHGRTVGEFHGKMNRRRFEGKLKTLIRKYG